MPAVAPRLPWSQACLLGLAAALLLTTAAYLRSCGLVHKGQLGRSRTLVEAGTTGEAAVRRRLIIGGETAPPDRQAPGRRLGGRACVQPLPLPTCLRTLAAHLGPSNAPPHTPPPCSFPSICSIRSAEGRHHCAATLVAPRLAVTAAYCVAPPAAESPTLWCGLHHQFSQSQGTFDVLHTVRTVRWAVLSSAQQASCPFLLAGGLPGAETSSPAEAPSRPACSALTAPAPHHHAPTTVLHAHTRLSPLPCHRQA